MVSSLAFYCSPYSAQLAYGLQTLLPSVETKSILQCLGWHSAQGGVQP